ncbi:MAG: hypothetical protein HQK62_12385, partial [Desulfamplus sp.]|nr:hypothetical protein [Desulfamplus sp.]
MPQIEAYLTIPGLPTDMAVSKTENRLYISSRDKNAIYTIDLNSLKVSDREISVNGTPGMVESDGSRYIYILNNERSGSVYRLDTKTDLVVENFFQSDRNPVAAAISPSGEKLYVVSGESNSITYSFISGGLVPSPQESILKKGETLELTVKGGSGSYTWSAQAGNLSSYTGDRVIYTAPDFGGRFNVIAMDANSRSKAEFSISVNDLKLNPPLISVSNREPITFNVIGGTPPFSFETLSGGTYKNDPYNTSTCYFTPPESSGIYTLTARDKNNFTDTAQITYMTMPLAISPKRFTMAPESSEIFTITGGIPPYTVNYSDGICDNCQNLSLSGSQIKFKASKNAGETYIRVFDSTGRSETALISVYDGMFVSPSHLYLPLNTTGVLDIIGGTPEYTVAVTGGSMTSDNYSIDGDKIKVTGNIITSDQDILLTITDGNKKSFTVLITVTGALGVSPALIENSTLGQTHKIKVSGGTGSYTWMSNQGDVKQISENEFLYTAPPIFGTYNVEFQDGAGSSKVVTIKVLNDNLILSPSNIVIYPGENAQFSILGGVPPYNPIFEKGNFRINGNSGIFEAPDTSGSFNIGVLDQSGREFKAEIKVVAPIQLDTALNYVNPGDTISISVQGGAGGYQFAAESGQLSATRGNRLLYKAPERIGNYWVRATDALSNTASCLIVVGNAPTVSPSYAFLKPSGKVTFKVQGGFPGYIINVDAGELPVAVGQGLYEYTAPVTKGFYNITATDTKGIITQLTVEVGDSDVFITPEKLLVAPGGKESFEIKGGKAPYRVTTEVGSLTLNGQEKYLYESPDQNDLSGSFFIKVEDAAGNRGSAVVEIKPDGLDQDLCIELNEDLSM